LSGSKDIDMEASLSEQSSY